MSVKPLDIEPITEIELKVYRGDSISWDLVALLTDDTPVDLSSVVGIIFSVKQKVSDAATLFTRMLAGGITVTNPTAGVYRLSLINENTNDLEPGTYECDVEVELTADNFFTPARGTLKVLDEITRSAV